MSGIVRMSGFQGRYMMVHTRSVALCRRSGTVTKLASALSFVGLLAMVGCATGRNAEWPMNPRALVGSVEQFRELAGKDATKTFPRFMDAEIAETFDEVTACGWVESHPFDLPKGLSKRVWEFFFNTSLYDVQYTGPQNALVAFYNPWSDVVVITMWRTDGEWMFISDAEVLAGDFLRKAGRPPYSGVPIWRSGNQLPLTAVADATYRTIRAFHNVFSPMLPTATGNTGNLSAAEIKALSKKASDWRSLLPNLKVQRFMDANHLAAGLMLNRNFASIDTFGKSDQFASVRAECASTLGRLRNGQIKEVLAAADETPTHTQKVLAEEMSDKWNRVSIVSFADSKACRFVFLQTDQTSDYYLCFTFRPDAAKKQWRLRRIDLVNHKAYYLDKTREKEGVK